MAKFFVNWRERKILTETEREQRIEANTNEILDETDALEDFLDRECTLSELFNMTQGEREELQERFRAWAELRAEEDFDDEFDEYETAYFQ